MLKIFVLITFLIPSLLGCGYQSIYSEKKDLNFYITSIEFSGNSEINKFIENKLSKFDDKKKREIKVIINSNFEKNPIIKDKKGNVTNYELVAQINLTVKKDGSSENISFNESLKIEKNNDNFEQVKYETKIKKNLYQILANKIIFFLKNTK
tara:strand:+ start:214 stop:669 length:456 start_codon:yes stop_codon:yes gene_type:complete